MRPVLLSCIPAGFGLLSLSCLAASPQMPPVDASSPIEKPVYATLGQYEATDVIEVKFRSGDVTRLRAGLWHSQRRGALDALVAFAPGQGIIERAEPLFTLDTGERAALEADASGMPALHQWFRLHLRQGEDLVAAVNRLNALDEVEVAYPAPLPVPMSAGLPVADDTTSPPPASPNLEGRQMYALPAGQGGIDAVHARSIPGGDGSGVRVADIEYSWNWQHEDLKKLTVAGTWIRQGSRITDPFNDNGHGTAVLGEMVGDANGYGVRGLVNGATPHYVNVTSPETGYNPANAVVLASRKLSAGDVILIEQQFPGPSPCTGFVAPEWIPSIYDAVSSAVRRGIHVVQTAGNGNVNLDDTRCFGSPFPGGRPDSGSIIVGAGSPWPTAWCSMRQAARSRLGFSTYGRRVNVQGVGQCVTSTGYGDIYNGGGNALYTGRFSGTSSSAPIVTAAVAALSGIAKARGKTITPQAMRSLLVETGTPQVGNTGHIGPLPDLRAAIERLDELP